MQGTRILVVDDDCGFSESLADILREKGYSVDIACSALVAIEKVKGGVFEVILMDIKMPVMDGVEAFKVIKKLSPSTIVIMMTAYAVEDLMQEALKEGAFGVLRKPLDIDKVIEQIELARNKGVLILVTDDDLHTRETFKDVLEAKGYKVSLASTGEEAVEICRERPQDIIFLDMKLPALNGLEVYLSVKTINPKICCVLITGYYEEMKDWVDFTLSRSAYACLQKPVDMDEVLGLIEKLERKIIKKSEGAPTVLIVDDNPNVRVSLADVLKSSGFVVSEAQNSADALEKAKIELPNIILLDTAMPGMDGFEVCRRIKKVEKLSSKVIIYTGNIDVIDAVKAKEMGADDYCVKGRNPVDLIRAMNKLL